jgi:hypothetical protein
MGWSFTTHQANFLAPLPGIEEEEEAPSSTWHHQTLHFSLPRTL